MQLGLWATPTRGRLWLAILVTMMLASWTATRAETRLTAATSSSLQYAEARAGKPKHKKFAGTSPYRPMKVAIVRSAAPGCEPDCVEWIAAQGRIDHTTPAAFKRAIARLGDRKLPVLLESRGGTVDHGIEAGHLIRAKGLDVVVGKTVQAQCPLTKDECRKLKAKGVEFGTPVAKYSACASSCAFILAGGVRRYVGPWTGVGLHEIKSISTIRRVQRFYRIEQRASARGARPKVRKVLLKERTLWTKTVEGPSSEKTYDRIARYFVEMGVSAGIMPLLRSAPHSSIRVLTATELKETRLATDFTNGEQLIAKLSDGGFGAAKPAVEIPGADTKNAVSATSTAMPSGTPVATKPARPSGGTTSAAAASTTKAGVASKPEEPPRRIAPRIQQQPRPAPASTRHWSPFDQ
jgi:hypothetical protein